MLSIRDLHVRFGQAHILQGVSLDLDLKPFALVGRNGMGKTTLCKTIMGMVKASEGDISLNGTPIHGLSSNRICRHGIAIVPQGRRVFPSLSVDEHLRLVSQGKNVPWTVERTYETFPRLAERKKNGGAQLSGGEQQMLAIARALLLNPKLIIMDEPSEGLAPVIVDHLIEVLKHLSAEGMGLLLVEQNLHVATEVAETVSVMLTGRITATLPSAQLSEDEELQRRYLGVSVHGHH